MGHLIIAQARGGALPWTLYLASTDRELTNPQPGIYQKIGPTWTQILPGRFTQICSPRGLPLTLYAFNAPANQGSGAAPSGDTTALWQSLDGGASWSDLTANLPADIAGTGQSRSTFLSVADGGGALYLSFIPTVDGAVPDGGALYLSTDAGGSWGLVDSGDIPANAQHNHGLNDITDSSVAYVMLEGSTIDQPFSYVIDPPAFSPQPFKGIRTRRGTSLVWGVGSEDASIWGNLFDAGVSYRLPSPDDSVAVNWIEPVSATEILVEVQDIGGSVITTGVWRGVLSGTWGGDVVVSSWTYLSALETTAFDTHPPVQYRSSFAVMRGAIYYLAPLSTLFVSRDGGITWAGESLPLDPVLHTLNCLLAAI